MNNNHFKYISFLFSFLTISISSAQVNFEPAVIVTNMDDTLSGYIDFREWGEGPFSISYKTDISHTEMIYTPNTLHAFTVHGQVYLSKQVTIDKSPHEIKNLYRSTERLYVEDTIFLQLIVGSPDGLNLFYHRDENGKDHFFCNWADSLIELRIVKYFDVAEYSTVTYNEYVIRLMQLTGDCPDAITYSDEIKYRIPSLAKIVTEYNTCMGYQNGYVFERPKPKSLLGISAGPSLAKITYLVEGDGQYFGKADYTFDPGFTAGGFFYFDLPNGRESAWICNDLILHKFKTAAVYEGLNFNLDQHASIEFDQLDLKLVTTIKFQSNTEKLKPFVKFGLTNSVALINQNNSTLINRNIYSNEIDTLYYENDVQKSVYHNGATIGAGITWKNKYFLEFRYERAFIISSYLAVSSHEDDLYATLFYAF